MTTVSQVAQGLIPVLVGLRDPSGTDAPPSPGPRERSRLGSGGVDWTALGVDPRWIGRESSDCAAALTPGIYASEGSRERDRYIAGAARRGEIAVLISTIGNADGTHRNVFSSTTRPSRWPWDLDRCAGAASRRGLRSGSRKT